MSEHRHQIRIEVTEALKILEHQSNDIGIRLLKALLTHAPTTEGMLVIATDIIAASEEEDGLALLAKFYTTGLILPMKANGQTPQVSFHPSRDVIIKSTAEGIAADLETAKRDKTTLKRYTLHRDGYRCVATHRCDGSTTLCPDYNSAREGLYPTVAAHILPFSLMSIDTNKKLFKKASIWTVIESFTNIKFTELLGDNINSLTNVMTLDLAVHQYFGELKLWFEPVPEKPTTYIIRKAQRNWLFGTLEDGQRVVFKSPDEDKFPIPDRRYLAFHAAVAKVVHMAGMAEYLDDIIRKQENIRVLSDESHVEYLDGLLRIAQRSVLAY